MNTEMKQQMFLTAWWKIKDLLWGKLYYVNFSFQIQISCIFLLIKSFISCLWQNNFRSVNHQWFHKACPQEATPNCWLGVAACWCYLSKFSESHPIFNIIGRKPKSLYTSFKIHIVLEFPHKNFWNHVVMFVIINHCKVEVVWIFVLKFEMKTTTSIQEADYRRFALWLVQLQHTDYLPVRPWCAIREFLFGFK